MLTVLFSVCSSDTSASANKQSILPDFLQLATLSFVLKIHNLYKGNILNHSIFQWNWLKIGFFQNGDGCGTCLPVMHSLASPIHQLRILYGRYNRTFDGNNSESYFIGFQHSWWLSTKNKGIGINYRKFLLNINQIFLILAIDKVAAISHDRESPNTFGILCIRFQLPKLDGWPADSVSWLRWICWRLQYH